MSECWLTIVTITKDDSAGLACTLQSSRRLRQAGAEHIVIDGTVGETTFRESVGEQRDEVMYIKRAPQGIADAFNAGLQASHGKWIWYLNGGDRAHETLSAEWLHQLLDHSRAEIVTGGLHFDGEPAPRSTPALAYQWPLIRCWIAHPATLVRRSFLEVSGGFRTNWKVAMDYDFWIRSITRQTVVDVISRPLAHFDLSGVSQNPHSQRQARKEEARLVMSHSGRLVVAGLWTALRALKRVASAAWGGGPFR